MFEWTDWLRQTNFSLIYYAKIDPYQLSIDEWARKVKELQWIRDQETKSKE